MIEATGWININISLNDDEHDSKDLYNIVEKIKNFLTPENIFNQVFEIKDLNGNYILFIGLNHNHDNGYSDLILKIISKIGKIASGSYGIVHIRNHDDYKSSNNYKILKLARGKVKIEEDKLISPCRPIIEN